MFVHSDAAALKRKRGLSSGYLQRRASAYGRHETVKGFDGYNMAVSRTVKVVAATHFVTRLTVDFVPQLPSGSQAVVEVKGDAAADGNVWTAVRGALGRLAAEHNQLVDGLTRPAAVPETDLDGFRVYPPQAAAQEAA